MMSASVKVVFDFIPVYLRLAHRPEWRWAVKVRYLDTDALGSGQQHRAETVNVVSVATVGVRVEQPGAGATARVAAT